MAQRVLLLPQRRLADLGRDDVVVERVCDRVLLVDGVRRARREDRRRRTARRRPRVRRARRLRGLRSHGLHVRRLQHPDARILRRSR